MENTKLLTKKKLKFIIILTLLFLVLILASNIFGRGWIFYHDGPYKGKVVDADTGEPIEGAAVVEECYLNLYGGPGGPIPKYCDVKEGITDKNGEFMVPKTSCFYLWPFAKLDVPRFTVFKPIYLSYPPRDFKTSFFTGDEFQDKKKHQVIKLGKAKNFNERRSTLALVDIFNIEKVPHLLRLVNEERKNLGFKD